ncbi:MAG: sulfite exporter TauE/SafE family protein [Syntrophomonadaceae bacterium]|nr:sulfite exporter TauE/SafE family protein [Syntrophomonadaceae bacterium]
MMTVIILIITGIIAGILSAILGIGGGIVILPATQLLLHFDPATAVATTLLAIALTTISGAYGHYRNGIVEVKTALLVGSGGVIGVILGSYIFKNYLTTNTIYIEGFLGIIFLLMVYRMGKDVYRELRDDIKPEEKAASLSGPLWLVLLGMFVGILTGMLGLGGGFIIVPAMLWLFGIPPMIAVGNTLLAMVPITMVGALIKLGQGFVNLNAGLVIGLGSIFGAQIGVKISSLVNPVLFKAVFTLIFAYLALSYLYPFVSMIGLKLLGI